MDPGTPSSNAAAPTATDTVDDVVRLRFESAWKAGEPITIEACLEGLAGSARVMVLEQLVESEMTLAWQSGRGTTVEGYLRRFPELDGEPERVRRLVTREIWVRHRFADSPSIDTYRGRFPEIFAEPGAVDALARVVASAEHEAGPLGRYRIDVELGRGGFGTVWAARDPRLGRVVAIKQLHPHVATRDDTRRRFIEEARVAARLEHPGVVPVYELGEAEGAPYFAMKLVRGETLADAMARVHDGEHAAPQQSDAVARARLLEAFLVVARTMAFAHAKGVIHRDLKPQNVILGDYGETVILDWGLAKSLDEREAARRAAELAGGDGSDSGITMAGAIMGTPAYMAPEQARGEIDRLDRKSDVFSLGAMLYELLTGHLPFEHDSALEIMNDVASSRPVPVRPRQHVRGVPRALEAICLKALEKDPAKRYPDAAELAADLSRHLAGAPVSAHRERLVERAARWARHHRGLVLTMGLALIVVAVAAVVAAVLVDGERAQARNAETLAREAEAVAARAREQAEVARDAALHHAYVASLALALRAWEDGDLAEADRQLAATPEARRGWEYRYVRGLVQGAQRELSAEPARRIAVDATGEVLAVSGAEPIVHIHARRSGGAEPAPPIVSIPVGEAPDDLVLVSPNRLVVRSGTRTRTFSWSGTQVTAEAHGEALRLLHVREGPALRFEAPNRLVMGSGAAARSVHLHVATPGTEDANGEPAADFVAVAPGLDRAVTIDWLQRLRATDLASGSLIWDVPLPALASPQLVFGRVIVVAQDRRFGGRVTRFDPATGEAREPSIDFERPVTAIAASPDRDVFVAGTIDGALHVVVDGLERNVLRAHRAPVRDVLLVGDELVSAASDGVRAWDPARTQGAVEGMGYQVAFTPEGYWLDGMARVNDRWTGAPLGPQRPIDIGGQADQIAVAGRSSEAVVMLVDGRLWIGARASGDVSLVGEADVFAVAASGRVISHSNGAIAMWDADRRAAIRTPTLIEGGARVLAIVPGSGPGGGPARGEGWSVVRGAEGETAAVSADGEAIAIGRPKGPVSIQDRRGEVRMTLDGSFEQVTALGFTADGQRLVVADGLRVGIWDVARGLEVMSLAVADRVRRIATSDDGRSIGLALFDGRVVIFNAAWPR